MEDGENSEDVKLWVESRTDEKYNIGMRIISGIIQYWFMMSQPQFAEYEIFLISTIDPWTFVLRSIW